jgi:hypothetical protein
MRSTSIYAVWDDHDVRNDYDITVDPALYAAGRQAFREFMPIMDIPVPSPGCLAPPMFKVFRWGVHADLIVLDTHSCRSPSAAPAQITTTSGVFTDRGTSSVVASFCALPFVFSETFTSELVEPEPVIIPPGTVLCCSREKVAAMTTTSMRTAQTVKNSGIEWVVRPLDERPRLVSTARAAGHQRESFDTTVRSDGTTRSPLTVSARLFFP